MRARLSPLVAALRARLGLEGPAPSWAELADQDAASALTAVVNALTGVARAGDEGVSQRPSEATAADLGCVLEHIPTPDSTVGADLCRLLRSEPRYFTDPACRGQVAGLLAGTKSPAFAAAFFAQRDPLNISAVRAPMWLDAAHAFGDALAAGQDGVVLAGFFLRHVGEEEALRVLGDESFMATASVDASAFLPLLESADGDIRMQAIAAISQMRRRRQGSEAHQGQTNPPSAPS